MNSLVSHNKLCVLTQPPDTPPAVDSTHPQHPERAVTKASFLANCKHIAAKLVRVSVRFFVDPVPSKVLE